MPSKYTPLSAKVRFTALQSGEIDVLARNTTWTFTRDNALGLEFVGVNYYDGQGFMVRKDLGITSALELGGASVCTNTGTTTELNVADYFRANSLQYEIVAFEKAGRGRGRVWRRPLRRLDHRPLGPRRQPREAGRPGRPCRPAGDDLQGAAGPSRTAR